MNVEQEYEEFMKPNNIGLLEGLFESLPQEQQEEWAILDEKSRQMPKEVVVALLLQPKKDLIKLINFRDFELKESLEMLESSLKESEESSQVIDKLISRITALEKELNKHKLGLFNLQNN